MGFLALTFTQSKSTTLWFPLFFWCGLDISCYLHQGLWCLESNIKFSHYSSYISSFVFYTWFPWTCYSLKFFHLYDGFVNACKKNSNGIKGVQIYLECHLQHLLLLPFGEGDWKHSWFFMKCMQFNCC